MSNRSGAILLIAVGIVGVCCAGCSVDYYARRLVEHNTAPGKAHLGLLGSGEQMRRQGRIDLHRRITVHDGIVIDVWCIFGEERPRFDSPRKAGGRGTVVLVHGLLDSKARYHGLGRRLAGMGFDVVLPDLRAHGRSTGRYVTFGAKEHLDIKAVMDELLTAHLVHPPVYAFGVSLGAAVAIQYGASDPRCKGVCAVAPFKDLRSIARNYVPLMGEEKFEAVLVRAGEIAGFDPAAASTIAAARMLDRPMLVVHGQADAIVPFEQGKAVYEAAPGPKRFIPVPLASHSTILLGREEWFAQQVNMLARTGLTAPPTRR